MDVDVKWKWEVEAQERLKLGDAKAADSRDSG